MSQKNKLGRYMDDDNSDEERDYKSKKKTSEMPENLTMEDIMRSTMAQDLMKQRGFEFEEGQSKAKPTTQTKAKQPVKETIIPGQAVASLKTLLEELEKAEKSGNFHLALSLIETVLDKELSAEERLSFQTKRLQLMFTLKRFDQCQAAIQDLIIERPDIPKNLLLKLLIVLSNCHIETNNIRQGYLDYLRAQGVIHSLKFDTSSGGGMDKDDLKSWNESELDKDLRAAEELGLVFQVRNSKEKNFIASTYVTGMNMKSNLLGLGPEGAESSTILYKMIPELRNRKVLSIACGEHHTLALVEGGLYNLNEVTDPKNKEKSYCPVDLFGWGENTCGQVMGYETTQVVSRPTVIRYFFGKEIKGIHANRASSICYDSQGNVYEWGYQHSAQSSGVRITFTHKNGIEQCRLGHSFAAVLTKDNQLYLKGAIEGVFEDHKSYQLINKSIQIDQIEAGSNHLVVLSKEDIYTFGANNIGQLGIGDTTKKANTFQKVEIPKYIKPPKKVFAFKDTSCYISQEGDFFMWGAITENKTQWKPLQYELDTGNPIMNAAGNGSQIFLIDRYGKVYVWELETSSKFKLYKNIEEESFENIAIGRGFQIFTKGFVEPSLCQIEEYNPSPQSYHPTEYKLRVKSKEGPFYQPLSHPLRYYVFFSHREDPIEEIMMRVIKESKMAASTKNQLTYLNNFDCPVLDVSVKSDPLDPSLHIIHFMFEKDGHYFMYVFINEQPIMNQPIEINMLKSKEQDQIEQSDEAKRKQIEEARKQREEALRKKQLDEQNALEEKERKLKETQLQAETRLRNHMEAKRLEEQKAEEERRLRRELLTGGGFNLEKAALLKQNSMSSEESKSDSKSKTTSTRTTTAEAVHRGSDIQSKGSTTTPSFNQGTKKLTKAPSIQEEKNKPSGKSTTTTSRATTTLPKKK